MRLATVLPNPSLSPSRTGDSCSDSDLYRFGLKVGFLTLPVSPTAALKRLMLPVEYVRCIETRYVLQHLKVTAGHRVLDVGSPKLLSLFLAAKLGATVSATDLSDYFFADYGAYAKQVLGRDHGRYRMETQDARALTYPAESFDRVFSISAIEHIPDQGDRKAIEEIARVLRPGGVVCLTFPWSADGYLEEFKGRDDPDVYWASSSHTDSVFYQRLYDATSLNQRLLAESGLLLSDLSFWGERTVPVEHYLLHRRLPRFVRSALCPLHFPLSRIFLRSLSADEPSRKKVACLTLRKP